MYSMSRRNLLKQGTLGIDSLALSSLLQNDPKASSSSQGKPQRHHPARAKNVIFMHMVGGPSQMDTFDPKPELEKWDGKPLPEELTRGQKFAFITPQAKAIKSPYKFAPRGQSGIVMSDLFPHLAKVADEMTLIRSMKTNEINHGSGELFLHTGHGRMGRPTFGAWTIYGLGTENENLPAYVVLKDKAPVAGPSVWSRGLNSAKVKTPSSIYKIRNRFRTNNEGRLLMLSIISINRRTNGITTRKLRHAFRNTKRTCLSYADIRSSPGRFIDRAKAYSKTLRASRFKRTTGSE